eukprot:6178108-Pleurochrysis_carterae.AAC.3
MATCASPSTPLPKSACINGVCDKSACNCDISAGYCSFFSFFVRDDEALMCAYAAASSSFAMSSLPSCRGAKLSEMSFRQRARSSDPSTFCRSWALWPEKRSSPSAVPAHRSSSHSAFRRVAAATTSAVSSDSAPLAAPPFSFAIFETTFPRGIACRWPRLRDSHLEVAFEPHDFSVKSSPAKLEESVAAIGARSEAASLAAVESNSTQMLPCRPS